MSTFIKIIALNALLCLFVVPATAGETLDVNRELCIARFPAGDLRRLQCLEAISRGMPPSKVIVDPRRELNRLGTPPSRAIVDPRQDLDRLQNERVEIHIPGAAYRVAVFTFEDPDGTGLGNALASLISREVLLRSSIGSIGVLRYEGSLASSPSEPLSYFDKVELLTGAQGVTLAVWGMIRRSGGRVSIDTSVQLPTATLDSRFGWSLRLPDAMGGKTLVARASPSRLLVQRHEMSWGAAVAMATSMKDRDALRAFPADSAPVIATLPVGEVYSVTRREGDWVRLTTKDVSGWVRASGHCTLECAALLDASGFAVDLLSFMSNHTLPKERIRLSVDAQAFLAQLTLFERYAVARPTRFDPKAFQLLARWLKRDNSFAGGAAFANVYALAKLSEELSLATRLSQHQSVPYEDIKLPPLPIQKIAFDLAEASVGDPRNKDVLTNLSILFEYANDTERAALATRLAAEVR
jgi:hypothetical protein